ncbi:MAG TPA: efflux RND transporter permease subunit [Patescibacteria group bacterium]
MQEISSYLKKLKFDPALKNSFVARYVLNVRLMFLLVMSIVVWGIFGYINLPRRTNPEVEIPYIFVSTILPGANAEDVEQLVTVPVEDAIEGLDRISRLTSTSSNNSSFVVVEFEASVSPKDAREDVQAAVDTVNLPANALDPNVMDLDFENFPVWTFTVTSDADIATMTRFAEEMQETLEDESLISRASVTGLELQEFQILIKPEFLNQIGLDPSQLARKISSQTTSYPAGLVDGHGTNHGVSLDPVIESVEQLRQVQITVDGQTYTLGQIATVMERSAPNQGKAFYGDAEVTGQRSISFSVFKQTGANLDEAAADAKRAAAEVVAEYDDRFTLKTIVDYDELIQKQFDDLFNDFFTSIALVFGTLLLFLGIRQATIASLVIPISFLFSFGAVHALGYSLNFLTLFSLLLAQGMIVDDVIVMISAMTDYYKTKKFTPTETGLLVWRDFITPTLTSNLTNVWSFVPMLITSGIIGEFITSIPVVVIIALVGSTAISLLVTIPLMVMILKLEIPSRVVWFSRVLAVLLLAGVLGRFLWGNSWALLAVAGVLIFAVVAALTWREVLAALLTLSQKSRMAQNSYFSNITTHIQTGFFSIKGVVSAYKQVLISILATKGGRRKTIFAVVVFSLFSYMLVPLGFIKNEFFPSVDQEQLYVGLELPIGTNIETTTNEGFRLLEELRHVPEAEYVIAEVGSPVENNFISSVAGGESNKVRYSLKLPPLEDRDRTSMEIAQSLREKYKKYAEGKVVVTEVEGGPPTGADLQITLFGPELNVLELKADELITYLDSLEGAVDADKSIKPGVSQIVFVPDLKLLEENKLSVDQVGSWLRTYLSGMQVTEERFDGEEKKEVIIRLSEETISPETLAGITIPNSDDVQVPLLSVGSLKLSASPTRIEREGGERSITITAAVATGYNVIELGQKVEAFADTDLNLPAGYTWKTGGVNEENQKSINSMIQAMGIAAILIAATMVVQLQSFRKALIVMLVIPLAVSGVYVLFALTGTPISLPALIGVLALFGIVVKNSILIVDKINANIEVGIPFREAIADGASSRLEPIIFSSITNFIGLLPITISDPLWRGLGGAIISGLTFSGLIMLFFIPVVYYVWFASEYEKATT